MDDHPIWRLPASFIVALLICAASPSVAQPVPDKFRAAVTVASDYVLHGLAQTTSGPSLRLSFDYEHPTGFFAGGALANVEYRAERQFSRPREYQAVVYAGYVWRRNDWMANLTLSRYEYPDITISYDYTQLAATLSFRDRYFLTAARSSDYLAIYDDSEYWSAGIAQPWIRDLEFSVNAGRFRTDGYFAASYSFWDIGLSRTAGRFALDLRFHDNTYDRWSLLGNGAGDLWVLSLTHVFLPRDRN